MHTLTRLYRVNWRASFAVQQCPPPVCRHPLSACRRVHCAASMCRTRHVFRQSSQRRPAPLALRPRARRASRRRRRAAAVTSRQGRLVAARRANACVMTTRKTSRPFAMYRALRWTRKRQSRMDSRLLMTRLHGAPAVACRPALHPPRRPPATTLLCLYPCRLLLVGAPRPRARRPTRRMPKIPIPLRNPCRRLRPRRQAKRT